MKIIWRVSQYLFRYPVLLYGTLGLAVFTTIAAISTPILIGKILNSIENTQATSNLIQGTALLTFIYLIREVFNGLRIRMNNVLEQKVLVDMRRDLHQKLLHLPISFYDKRKSGEISSRVIEDVANVERALLDGTEQGTTALLTIVGVTGVLFWIQPFLAIFVFIPVPVLLIAGIYYAKGSRKVWKGVRESSADMNSLLVEDIQGNRLIQSFGLQKRETARFADRAAELENRTVRAMFRWANYHPTTNFITSLGMVAVVGLGGHFILQGSLDFGFAELTTYFLLTMMLYEPISRLHGINHLLAAGKASGERVFEVLDEAILIQDIDQPIRLDHQAPQIHFQEVSFQYSERAAVLENFSLELPPGKVTALVGHTGAGKSTVANLLLRSYDATAGSVLINGIDIKNYKLTDLREQIGFVAQDPFLFEGSIADNLRLAKEDASETEMIKALQGAAAWDFVQRLPQQLATNIGEKGIRLSQGEKQRLTIARVLLKNPPFVILDEATASVDTLTEKAIQDALESLTKERTVLAIAHRLSTIARADHIVVMQRGKIVEQGDHHTLLDRQGHYAKLWNHQSDIIEASPTS